MARRFIIAMGLLLISSQILLGQDEKGPFSIEFSAGSGPILQPDNLKTYFKSGFALQTGLKADVSNIVSFRLNVHYLPLKLNSDRVVEELEPIQPTISSISYDGGTRHSLLSGLDLLIYFNSSDRTIRPYIYGGGGYALVLRQDIISKIVLANGNEFAVPLEYTDNEHYPAIRAGLGLEGGGKNTRYYIETEYIVMLSEDLQHEIVLYPENELYSPHGPTQTIFIHAGLRVGL
ncbi:hypothetical protein HQ585_10420 [candidate division KSB1 bacterium]|nr:hypothetical protein [candidate division KSB1 bacterium]